MASLVVTYVLWLCFGWLGWHHVYLDRWRHAVAWFMTCGGGLGVGWLRDLWRIPDYVAWTNKDKQFEKRHLYTMAVSRRANCSTFRLYGMLGLGFVLTLALCGIVPDYTKGVNPSPVWYLACRVLYIVLVITGSTLGVYLVGNIGEVQCSILYPLLGSAFSVPWLVANNSNFVVPTIIAGLVTWWKGLRWKPLRDKSKSSCYSSVLFYSVAVFMWLALLLYGFYFTAEVTLNNGEKVPLRVVVANFFKSSAWQSTKDTLYQLFTSLWRLGWSKTYYDAWDHFDFSVEMNSLKILGLDQQASYEDIKRACRKMSKLYHPDLQRTEEAKAEGQKQFILVQEACSLLTKFRSKNS